MLRRPRVQGRQRIGLLGLSRRLILRSEQPPINQAVLGEIDENIIEAL
jgi:hypothetical protein